VPEGHPKATDFVINLRLLDKKAIKEAGWGITGYDICTTSSGGCFEVKI